MFASKANYVRKDLQLSFNLPEFRITALLCARYFQLALMDSDRT